MSRLARLALLVSIGLNLGLGWTVLHALRPEPPREPEAARSWRDRPAPGDSTEWRRMMHHRVERLASLLDLNPTQTRQLQDLQGVSGPRVHAQRELVEAARDHLRDVSSGATLAPEEVRKALGELRHTQAALDSLTQEFLLQELALMDAPQRARYLELLPLDRWRGGGPGAGSGPDGGRRRRPQ